MGRGLAAIARASAPPEVARNPPEKGVGAKSRAHAFYAQVLLRTHHLGQVVQPGWVRRTALENRAASAAPARLLTHSTLAALPPSCAHSANPGTGQATSLPNSPHALPPKPCSVRSREDGWGHSRNPPLLCMHGAAGAADHTENHAWHVHVRIGAQGGVGAWAAQYAFTLYCSGKHACREHMHSKAPPPPSCTLSHLAQSPPPAGC